ncbi:GNAT family N-acetyltransferase [Paenibacillus sp. MWE-103]|uniref:GNAT family N-acetyltransferase n=1 Tax=Paenibacillus artemisiicola TaxID=1172618 RepID=A0ABS3W865_9BACL|nr:GNAT family N-acetyltransferase [Paenibacillus artemisiicola]MBO7744504.1 GNAT family N-acetyltransferase [Paenibacillus artemisiicola]
MIKELANETEWLEGYPVMHELRTHLGQDAYLACLRTMREEGYTLLALYERDEIAALAGICMLTNFYFGRHVFIYDLVTKSSMRSKGYGNELLAHVHRYAKEHGCGIVALGSGLANLDAHRFYETKMGYEKTAYSFICRV